VQAHANTGPAPWFALWRTTGRSVIVTVPFFEPNADPPDTIGAATEEGGASARSPGGPEGKKNLAFSGRHAARPVGPAWEALALFGAGT
jgi:hypothetical protein